MHKFIFICLAFFLAVVPLAAFAQADDPTFTADYQAAEKLQQALKDNDRDAVADLVTYPLAREKPLRPIVNAKQFLAHWDEYFDEASIKAFLDSKADQYGWRGIALANGTMWFANGHIASIFVDCRGNNVRRPSDHGAQQRMGIVSSRGKRCDELV